MTRPALTLSRLQNQLQHCMLTDVHRLRRRLQKIRKLGDRDRQQVMLAQLQRDVDVSIALAAQRRQNIPAVNYPPELPISQKAESIKQTIRDNQVTVLCGETGSGKTTQLPKICLELGLGVRGKIGHTQPRRLAARTVSQRIAEELQVELGEAVGYKVRFADKSNDNSYIKLMTDGILLAECQHDPYLNQYDAIIVDEAHERSLNIDFLLGYLKRLLQKRKDLKLIITSATIDPERFARHFNNAPIINVSGRTWPVEVRYRPLQQVDADESKNLQQGVIDAIEELSEHSRGDVLVFLSGERDIRETRDAIQKHMQRSGRPQIWGNTEVLPLLARQSNAEQNRIFHPSSRRRIVLATNVAETSLTVPGIKYVIDSGLARISRYSWRSKIQRLPIEKISRASANQRKGRCGRVSEGICIRLYDEDDFNQRPEFTEPEIQRTSLASVILQMENQRLGHIDDFPFVEPPESRLISDGYKLLYELGAVNQHNRLTDIGRRLARLPIDPKLACMLLQAEKEGALSEVLVIVSALAVQDVRDRPMDKQQAADEKHALFSDKDSDFVFYLNLWQAYHKEKQALSASQLRKWCKQHYIAWMRMREWLDTHHQIKRMLLDAKMTFNKTAADYDAIHRALLSGLLANIGLRDEDKSFQGARNRKFNVFPGSALFKSPPKWLMAAEIVETTRVYARTAAKIDVRWLEQAARHLLKRHASNPHWEKKRGQVVAQEQAILYGLVVYAERRIDYGKVNPEEAREIFIRDALVAGDIQTRAEFYQHNRQLLDELERLEAKSRRRDVIDENRLFEFYDQHLPGRIHNTAKLEQWCRQHPKEASALLLTREQLMRDDATVVSSEQFPDTLTFNGCRFPVEYHFDPNRHCDGVTLVTPLAGLQALNPQRCEWLIPGLLHEKIVALIRSLPKALRKNFVPAPNFADACMEVLTPDDTSLCAALATQLKKMTGVHVPFDAWRLQQLPPHLFMNFRVIDANGETLAEGRDLAVLKQQLAGLDDTASITPDTQTEQSEWHRDNVGVEALEAMPESVDIDMHGVSLRAWPALVQQGKQVNLRLLESHQQAHTETRIALRQLFINAMPEQVKQLRRDLPDIQNLCLQYSALGSCDELKSSIVEKVIDEIFLQDTIESAEQFEQRLQLGRSQLYATAEKWCRLLQDILQQYRAVSKQIKNPSLPQLDMVSDIQSQLDHLFAKQFITTTPSEWLRQYPRYLRAIELRLEKAQHNASRDRQLRLAFADLWQAWRKRHEHANKQQIDSLQLNHYRWMLEEYRVSLFAQELKTRFPVSEKRLKKLWNEISDV